MSESEIENEELEHENLSESEEESLGEFLKDLTVRLSDTDKWLAAVIIGVVFLIIASPIIFKFSNSIFKYIKLPTIRGNGMPTIFGLLIHTLAFILIVRLLMH